MAESLERFKSYIGKKETATDVVTASAMLKFAATLGQENAPMEKGTPIPPGWYGAFFPASHRPSQMRLDGQASGGGIVPPIPLPRRRIGGTRVTFHEPLRIGDEITRVTEIADIRIDEGPNGAMATIVERHSISNSRGLGVVEERDLVMLSEARAEAASTTLPPVPAQAAWRQAIEPNPPLLFRFSAIRFNSHRIHYDRDYVTKVEKLPGLVVQSSLISQLMIEMCRKELPARRLASFDFKSLRQIYDTGSFTIAGNPAAGGREAALWALDADGRLAMTATAKFAA
ncbi:MAG: MaoC family dehydratase N-terminal domain-containing protein [Deltaproteobacteria bacterium]|nr:MaoC family dehydratase N-terminal domain-containing protein [Deltaproteobacteria bacterium]